MKVEKKMTCSYCNALLTETECFFNHTYVHCLMAKAFPDNWREMIKKVRELEWENLGSEVEE